MIAISISLRESILLEKSDIVTNAISFSFGYHDTSSIKILKENIQHVITNRYIIWKKMEVTFVLMQFFWAHQFVPSQTPMRRIGGWHFIPFLLRPNKAQLLPVLQILAPLRREIFPYFFEYLPLNSVNSRLYASAAIVSKTCRHHFTLSPSPQEYICKNFLSISSLALAGNIL